MAHNFKQLNVWKKAIDLTDIVFVEMQKMLFTFREKIVNEQVQVLVS